jgi:hypothetical protein
LRSCSYWDAFAGPKIVYPDIAQNSEFTFDEQGYFLVNTLYLMPTTEIWLLGLLNSKLIYWFYTKISTQIRGGFVRFIAQYVEQIPVPDGDERSEIAALVQALLARQAAGAETAALEAAIDAAVYRLFGVMEGEIAVVEGR